VDTTFDPGQLKLGRRLAIKVLNASKFVLSLDGPVGPVTSPVDASLLAALSGLVRDASASLDGYDHAGALEAIERFFWMFCDDYLELVKSRAYQAEGPDGASARSTLRHALSALLRLFAPFIPFVAEEAWSWWQPGSVHAAAWPTVSSDAVTNTGTDTGADPAVLATAAAVLGQIRKAKSAAKLSMRAEAALVVVRGPDEAALRASESDLRAAGNIADFAVEYAPELAAEVTLAEAVAS
jgi:valyl-tRNA synthetase